MLSSYRRELSVAGALVAVAAVMALAAPRFFTVENQLDLLLASTPVLIVALGMTLVIVAGQIDISVGSMFAVCGVLFGIVAKSGVPVPAAAAAACVAGGLLGALNGVLVAHARIPSIVATLGAMVVLRDALRWATEGAWVQDLPEGFQWFGLSQRANTALTAGSAVAAILAFSWVLRNVRAGRAVYATGSDADAARLAGIDPQRVTFWVFAILGVLTGLAAVLNSARFNQVPANAGLGLELKAIAAATVGGAAVTGGRGTPIGTALGVLLLGVIGPALTFVGVNAYWERAVEGGIILAAVAGDAVRLRSGRHERVSAARA